MNDELLTAVFIDFENLAYGTQDVGLAALARVAGTASEDVDRAWAPGDVDGDGVEDLLLGGPSALYVWHGGLP